MINYADAEILNVLPPYFKSDPDVVAISYALRMAMAKMLEFQERTQLYADIDGMPEYILDYMAEELRSKYYRSSMTIEQKRDQIRNTLAWYMRAGSIGAAREMIEHAFGDADIMEWWDFDGLHHQFDVEINSPLTPEVSESGEFARIIDSAKNLTSHLRRLHATKSKEQTIYIGHAVKRTKFLSPTSVVVPDPFVDDWYVDGDDLLVDTNGGIFI